MKKEYIDQLKEIKKNVYDFSNVNLVEMADLCLKNIGHKQSEIRDDLVYGVLAHLLHDQHFSENELSFYMNKLQSDEFLFKDMDNQDTYSILTRSFSILQLVILVYVHRRDNIISQALIKELYHRFLFYFEQEKVLTGYDQEVGWIHMVAHSADLFAQFMQVSWFDETHLEHMFESIAKKIKQGTHYFTFNEDERLVVAIKYGIDRKILSKAYLSTWVEQFLITEKPKELPERIYYSDNIKNFLRSLYFSLIDDTSYSFITDDIKVILSKNKLVK